MVEVKPFPTYTAGSREPITVPDWVWKVAVENYPDAHKNSEAVKKIQTLRWKLCKTIMAHLPKFVMEVDNAS